MLTFVVPLCIRHYTAVVPLAVVCQLLVDRASVSVQWYSFQSSVLRGHSSVQWGGDNPHGVGLGIWYLE